DESPSGAGLRIRCDAWLNLNDMSLPFELTSQRLGKSNCLADALTCMAGRKHAIIAASITDNDFVDDVLDLGAICADDTDENDTVPNELLDQSIEMRCISTAAMQHDFLWVWHVMPLRSLRLIQRLFTGNAPGRGDPACSHFVNHHESNPPRAFREGPSDLFVV